jgi:hypothetical protein
MRFNPIFAGAFVLSLAAGCAASNGGGHVVGNSIVSPEFSKTVSKDAVKETCGHEKDGKKGCHCDCCKDGKSCESCHKE